MTDTALQVAVIVTAVDAQQHVDECLKHLVDNTSAGTFIYLLDNGSEPPLTNPYPARVQVIRHDVNVGGNAVFHTTLPLLKLLGIDVVAHIHCDMMIREHNWDLRVASAFAEDPDLVLAGFVGSTELDAGGGRGLGTHLNFVGAFYEGFGQATPAEVHGIRSSGIIPVAVLDHCSMIFRVSHLSQLPPQEGNFAPGHFYDRILSAEVNRQGKHVAYIGIACDHFSGGTAQGCEKRDAMYRRWMEANNIEQTHPNLDMSVYLWSEQRFLSLYRDTYRFVPYRVLADYTVVHS